MQLDFDGGSERIVAEELLRVRTHRLSLLAECPVSYTHLNICRLIAERLKGKVLLDKEYKEGARFVFVLPVKKSI